MRKFSNISGYKVGSEPKIENSKEEQKLNELKFSIIELMNQSLRIQSYGSARKNILPNVKITGQELFVEALMNMLSDKSIKDQIKSLESLKLKNGDWESIDNSINELNNSLREIENLKDSKNHISKIKSLIDLYGDDTDNFDFFVDRYCSKIDDSNIAYQRSMVAKMMSESSDFKNYQKEKLLIIHDKFLKKAKNIVK